MDRHERAAKTQDDLLSILNTIGALLEDVREIVIDNDPEMNEKLQRKADSGDDHPSST